MTPPSGQPDAPLLGLTALAVSPRGNLLAGTYSNGVMISQDGGVNWSLHAAGLPRDGTVTSIALAPDLDDGGEAALLFAEPETYPYLGASAYRSRDGGRTWEGYPGLNEPVREIVYSPAYATDNTLFAVHYVGPSTSGARWRLLRSANRGASWSEVLPTNTCPLNVALSPQFAADRTAYAPRCDHVLKSTDGGVTWADVPRESGDFAIQHSWMGGLQVLPGAGAQRLLAQIDGQDMPRISNDGGRNWIKPYDENGLPFAVGILREIVFAPGFAENTTLFAFGKSYSFDAMDHLWRSTDGGQTWSTLAHTTTPECITGLRASPGFANDRDVWAATCDGLFASADAGRSWRFVHPGGSQLGHLVGPAQSGDGVGVALINRSAGRYIAGQLMFEARGEGWRVAHAVRSSVSIRALFPSADYEDERMSLVVTVNFGGGVRAMALRPQAQTPLAETDLPPGGLPEDYRVTYADAYATSGRISLVHGGSGALYRSTDRGRTWTHADPSEPGACLRMPVSGFGALWSANAALRDRLKCAIEDERGFTGVAQPFERGEMLRLVPDDPFLMNRWVYALLPHDPGGPALAYYYDIDVEPEPPPTPPPGLVAPDVLLLRAWQATPSCNLGSGPLGDLVGWATEAAHEVRFARQYFEGGVMIWRADRDEIVVYFPPEFGPSYVPAGCPSRYQVYTDIPGG